MVSSWKSLPLGEKIRRGHTFLWWALVFPVVVIAFCYTAVSNSLHAQAILADHTVTQATISVDEITPATRQLARFTYSFDVDGTHYSKNYPVPRYRADDVEVGGTIAVAYANYDPNESRLESLLAEQADMKSNLMSALTLSAIGALLIGMFWLFFNYVIERKVRFYGLMREPRPAT